MSTEQFIFRPAVKEKLKARVALVGPTGSGKTFTMLRVARGIVGPTGKIAIIDTEYGKSRVYTRSKSLPDGEQFEVLDLRPPYTPDRYIGALQAAARAGFDIVGVDSLSHAWMGAGGILDQVDRVAADAARKRNARQDNFSAWRDVTPQHNALVDALLSHPCHLIVCMRAKQAYEITDREGGGKKIEKLGMQAIQRDGIDYEFDVVGDIDTDHALRFSKTRCNTLDGKVIRLPDADLGRTIGEWLDDGAERPPERLGDCQSAEHLRGWCDGQRERISRKDDKAQAATREAIEAAAERIGVSASEALSWAGLR